MVFLFETSAGDKVLGVPCAAITPTTAPPKSELPSHSTVTCTICFQQELMKELSAALFSELLSCCTCHISVHAVSYSWALIPRNNCERLQRSICKVYEHILVVFLDCNFCIKTFVSWVDTFFMRSSCHYQLTTFAISIPLLRFDVSACFNLSN